MLAPWATLVHVGGQRPAHVTPATAAAPALRLAPHSEPRRGASRCPPTSERGDLTDAHPKPGEHHQHRVPDSPRACLDHSWRAAPPHRAGINSPRQPGLPSNPTPSALLRPAPTVGDPLDVQEAKQRAQTPRRCTLPMRRCAACALCEHEAVDVCPAPAGPDLRRRQAQGGRGKAGRRAGGSRLCRPPTHARFTKNRPKRSISSSEVLSTATGACQVWTSNSRRKLISRSGSHAKTWETDARRRGSLEGTERPARRSTVTDQASRQRAIGSAAPSGSCASPPTPPCTPTRPTGLARTPACTWPTGLPPALVMLDRTMTLLSSTMRRRVEPARDYADQRVIVNPLSWTVGTDAA